MIEFTLQVTSLAPGDTSTMSFTFTIDLIDNPCIRGFSDVPPEIAVTYMLLDAPYEVTLGALNNNDCTYELSIMNTKPEANINPTLIAIEQPGFVTLENAIDKRQVKVNIAPKLKIQTGD